MGARAVSVIRLGVNRPASPAPAIGDQRSRTTAAADATLRLTSAHL